MNFRSLTRQLAAASLAWGAFAAASHATVLTTADLSAIGRTSWGSVMTTPVHVDFGAGYGTGTITVTAINGGVLNMVNPAYASEAYNGLALDGTTTLNVTQEAIVQLLGTPTVPGQLTGFNVSVALDSGNFAPGSALMVRSLDWRSTGLRQFFSPGDAFSANPYSTSLPSDFGLAGGTLIDTGPDADGDLWSTNDQAAGRISQGRAFSLSDATDSFDFRFLATDGYNGSFAFSIALPAAAVAQVPEPQSLALVLAALAICGGICVRRKSIRS